MIDRRDVLRPGTYASIPLTVLARRGISRAAACLYGVILSCFRPGRATAWPSRSYLASAAGLSLRGVTRCVAALEQAGLLAVERRAGGLSLLALALPAWLLVTRPSGPGAKKPPPDDPPLVVPPVGSFCPGGRDKMSPIRTVTPTPLTPPSPPQGGGPARGNLPLRQVTQRIAKAYWQAFHARLPAAWARRIRQEWRDGDRAALAVIDAATLTAARRFGQSRKLACYGLGTVILYLHDQAADAAARTAAAHAALSASAGMAAAADRQAKAHEEELAGLTRAFRRLPAPQRDRWRALAAAGPVGRRRPDLVEALAIGLYGASLHRRSRL